MLVYCNIKIALIRCLTYSIKCLFLSSKFSAMPKSVLNAKIACIDFSLQKAKMHLGVQVLITDPEKLDAIRQRYYFYGNCHCTFRFTFILFLSAYISIYIS